MAPATHNRRTINSHDDFSPSGQSNPQIENIKAFKSDVNDLIQAVHAIENAVYAMIGK
ncbi:MAG: hypothetical protein HOH65_04275 [Rhodospirillaceae bacterium]|jgi:hypothetical protein|nr:hypothetical protein [Rhodospirillaceae bacterium]